MSQASLVQDLWLGFGTRLRGRRLAPWEEPEVRVLLQLDPSQRLDDPRLAGLLEALATRLEVIAWQPHPSTPGPPPATLLADTRRLAEDGGRAFGECRVILGGLGLGAWLALASGDVPGLAGLLALAPSLASAGPAAPRPSELRAALAESLVKPLALPCLVVEGRGRPPAEARVTAEWLARAPSAAHLVIPGDDDGLLAPHWSSAIAGWAQAAGRA
jgi:hypothetical protein